MFLEDFVLSSFLFLRDSVAAKFLARNSPHLLHIQFRIIISRTTAMTAYIDKRGYKRWDQKGFSLIELLMVLVVIGVLAAVSVPYVFNYTKLYRSEDQALQIIDAMQEAGQRALSRRRNVRFEIDLTDNAMHIIDENGSDPHVLVRSIPIFAPELVRLDAAPNSVTRPNPPNYADAVFENDGIGHERGGTPVTGHRVFAARFRSDGSVVNAANVPLNASLFVWPPKEIDPDVANNPGEVRAITLFAGSGATRYWKYDGTTFKPY